MQLIVWSQLNCVNGGYYGINPGNWWIWGTQGSPDFVIGYQVEDCAQ